MPRRPASIDRRRFLALTAALLTGLPVREARAEDLFFEPRDGIWMYKGHGGTVGYMTRGGETLMVDSGPVGRAILMRKRLVRGTGKRRPGRFIDTLVNTHFHLDRTGGNHVFRTYVGKIVAHENVAGRLRPSLVHRKVDPAEAVADVTFAKQHVIKLAGETITLRHYGPAHTDGDAAVFFAEANLVHLGDLATIHVHPHVDTPGGGTALGMRRALKAIHDQVELDTKVVVGLGDRGIVVGGPEVIAHGIAYFDEMIGRVEKGLEKGWTDARITDGRDLKISGWFGVGDIHNLTRNLGLTLAEIRKQRK